MAWFLRYSWLVILAAFLLGLLVGWMLWRLPWQRRYITESRTLTEVMTAHERDIAAKDAEIARLRSLNVDRRPQHVSRPIPPVSDRLGDREVRAGYTSSAALAGLDSARAEGAAAARSADLSPSVSPDQEPTIASPRVVATPLAASTGSVAPATPPVQTSSAAGRTVVPPTNPTPAPTSAQHIEALTRPAPDAQPTRTSGLDDEAALITGDVWSAAKHTAVPSKRTAENLDSAPSRSLGNLVPPSAEADIARPLSPSTPTIGASAPGESKPVASKSVWEQALEEPAPLRPTSDSPAASPARPEPVAKPEALAGVRPLGEVKPITPLSEVTLEPTHSVEPPPLGAPTPVTEVTPRVQTKQLAETTPLIDAQASIDAGSAREPLAAAEATLFDEPATLAPQGGETSGGKARSGPGRVPGSTPDGGSPLGVAGTASPALGKASGSASETPASPPRRQLPTRQGVGRSNGVPVGAERDDLERVEGIGPRIAAALRGAGIHTYAELADSDVASLQSALEAAGLRFAPSLPTWSRQARLLADGDEDGFMALTDQLVGGRDIRRRS